MDEPNIVKTTYSEQATILFDEPGGRVRAFFRRIGRKLGLISRARPALSLFQQNMCAYRFETDDGRVSIVPMSRELARDAAFDAEAVAREQAVEALGKIAPQSSTN